MRRPTPEQSRNVMVALTLAIVTSVGVLMVVSVILLLAGNEESKNQRELIISCTTPSGACYKESQSRTGEVVGSINEVSIAAAACGAAHPGDVEATEACVRKTLGDG